MNDYLAPTWPLVSQVARLTRTVTVRKTGKTTQEVVYLITDLTPIQASPRRLLDLARGHWSIENRLHSVRDVSFGEDGSRLRSGSAPADHGRVAQSGYYPHSSHGLLSDCGFSTPRTPLILVRLSLSFFKKRGPPSNNSQTLRNSREVFQLMLQCCSLLTRPFVTLQ